MSFANTYVRHMSFVDTYVRHMSFAEAYVIYANGGSGSGSSYITDIGMCREWSGTIAMDYACV